MLVFWFAVHGHGAFPQAVELRLIGQALFLPVLRFGGVMNFRFFAGNHVHAF